MATPRTTYYGPGLGEYSRDQLNGPLGRLRKGDAAVSPDLARQWKLTMGQTFTHNGKTYRYADHSYIKPGVPNRNTVEPWLDEGEKPASGGNNPSVRSVDSQRTLSTDEWTTSPGDRRFLPSVGPTVEINQALPLRSAGDLDSEPSLFGSGGPSLEINAGDTPQVNRPHTAMDFVSAANPFDEWWKSVPVTGTGSVNAGATLSGDGGSIWSGEDTIGNFGGNSETPDFVSNSSLGPELNVDPALLNEGYGYPPAAPPLDETGVNQPPPPQPSADEWTTTPEDRRFLPESGEPTVQVPRSSGSGGNIGSFGTFGSPLTLGAYLNTALSSMRYGEGYPNTVESADEIRPGATSPNSSTGRMQRWNGQDWEDAGPIQDDGTGTTSIPDGVAVSPEVRKGELISGPVTGPMSPQDYESATWGGVRSTGYRDPRGSAIGNSVENVRNANLMLMSSQAFSGTPNDNAYSSDEGATRRFGQIGRLNEFGEYEQTGDIDPRYRSNIENYRGLVYGSQNRPRGVPATGRGG